MRVTSVTRCTVLCLMSQTCLVCPAGAQAPGIVTTSVQMKMTGKFIRSSGFPTNDTISIDFSESCTFSVVEWIPESVILEPVLCKPALAAGGGGSIFYPDPVNKTVSWTYAAEPLRAGNTKVDLDPSSGTGQLSVEMIRETLVTAKNTQGEGGGGLAQIAIHMTLTGAAGIVPQGAQFSGGKPITDLWRFRFDPKSKQISAGDQANYSIKWTERDGAEAEGTVAIRYSITMGPPPQDPGEMLFEPLPGYDEWLPAPLPEQVPGVQFEPAASVLRVRVRIQPKTKNTSPRKGRFYFILDGVTRQKGNCGNYPRDGQEKEDLKFADEQPAGMKVTGKFTAETEEEVSEAEIAVEATDTAAFGRLTAMAPMLGLKAIHKLTNTYSLSIPRDDDDDQIADVWERKLSLAAQSDPTADEDQMAGQRHPGDGFTVLDEYRGLVTIESGRKVHHRFSPKVKDLFIVDPEGIFDTALWYKISGIRAHKLDESMIAGGDDLTASRVVNFNSEDDSRLKYAVRVKTMAPAEDIDGERAPFPRQGLNPCGECKRPKDSDFAAVIPDRSRRVVEQLYIDLGKAVTDPASSQAQLLSQTGIPLVQAQQALSKLHNPAMRDAIARQMRTHLIMHEVGHACGAGDHNTPPPGKEEVVRACLMYVPGSRAYMRFIVNQVLTGLDAPFSMGYKQFCRGLDAFSDTDEKFNCFPDVLNVIDW